MKKSAIVCLLLVVIVTLTAGTALAQAIIDVQQVEFLNPADFDQEYIINDCTGDWMHMTGTFLHILKVSYDNNDILHVTEHLNAQNAQIENLTTGDIYIAAGGGSTIANHDFFNPSDCPCTLTLINNLIWTNPGSGAVVRAKMTTHLTFNADCDLTSLVLIDSLDCGPGN